MDLLQTLLIEIFRRGKRHVFHAGTYKVYLYRAGRDAIIVTWHKPTETLTVQAPADACEAAGKVLRSPGDFPKDVNRWAVSVSMALSENEQAIRRFEADMLPGVKLP